MAYQARELLAGAETAGGVRLVAREMAESEPAAVQGLARALIAEPGVVALLGCARGGKGTVVFARSEDCSVHVGNLLRDTLRLFGGGGGGRPDFAQGGGVAEEKLVDVLGAAADGCAARGWRLERVRKETRFPVVRIVYVLT